MYHSSPRCLATFRLILARFPRFGDFSTISFSLRVIGVFHTAFFNGPIGNVVRAGG